MSRGGGARGDPHRTKPEIAKAMVPRALEAGVQAAGVVADEVSGASGDLRRALEEAGQRTARAGRANEMPTTRPPYHPPGRITVGEIASRVATAAWARASRGAGAPGPRDYDWIWVPPPPAPRPGRVHGVLLRRPCSHPAQIAYSLTDAPMGPSLRAMARAAGGRGAIEDTFKQAKGQVGLDQDEVRSWPGWDRHVTLALLALAAPAVGAQEGAAASSRAPSRPPSPRSATCSPAWSGPRPIRPTTSRPGPAGAAPIRPPPARALANAGAIACA